MATREVRTNDPAEWAEAMKMMQDPDVSIAASITKSREDGSVKSVIGFRGDRNGCKLLLTAACISFAQMNNMSLLDLLTDIAMKEQDFARFAQGGKAEPNEEAAYS